jgi:hypothetical protein
MMIIFSHRPLMRNTVCAAFVHMAELRAEALRGLRAVAPTAPGFLENELRDAERQLKYRQLCLASCKTEACRHQCRLYEAVAGTEAALPLRPAA